MPLTSLIIESSISGENALGPVSSIISVTCTENGEMDDEKSGTI